MCGADQDTGRILEFRGALIFVQANLNFVMQKFCAGSQKFGKSNSLLRVFWQIPIFLCSGSTQQLFLFFSFSFAQILNIWPGPIAVVLCTHKNVAMTTHHSKGRFTKGTISRVPR